MRAIVVEHAEHEGAGHLLRAFAEAGVTVDLVRAWMREPAPESLDGCDALVVLGGPMGANDDDAHPNLRREAALLAESARSGRLTLGICLGSQLFARGLGGVVTRGAAAEIGIFPLRVNEHGMADPLLFACSGQNVVQWHQDTWSLPPGAELLASSDRFANQAFKVGRRGYGIQFHPELDRAMRADWAARNADDLRARGIEPRVMTPEGDALDELGRAFAEKLVALI
jgi:GMP synthase (glutamine-hydrolysing)